MVEPMTLVDPQGSSTPGGRRFCTTPEMYDPDDLKPTYSMQVVAEVFFCMSVSWLRQKIRTVQNEQAIEAGRLDDKGKPMAQALADDLGPIEPPRTESGHYAWRLYDIERLAHLFTRRDVIEGEHLVKIIKVIKAQAEGYGYLA